MRTKHSQREANWETVGYDTMAETGDDGRAKQACGLKLQALADELQPAMTRCKSTVNELRARAQALAAQLYQRHHPVSDTRMIALGPLCVLLLIGFVVAFLASATGHTLTFQLLGWNLSASIAVGLAITAIATVIGYLLHMKVLVAHRFLEVTLIVISSTLMLWALIDLAQARGAMAGTLNSTRPVASFVDDAPGQTTAADSASEDKKQVSETSVSDLFSNAAIKLAITADIAVGLLLGLLMSIRASDDFAGWRKLRSEKRQIATQEHLYNELVAILEMAKKRCAAGIVRAAHFENPNHPPYLIPVLLFMLLGAANVFAQDNIKRGEVILLDVSGSMSHKAETQNVFNELLQGVKQLLRTEPPDSRTWTFVISTDSFGSVQSLVRGWTPSAHGIFTDQLEQARRQLVTSFESKAAGLRPTASGTDIFGALARAKAALESDPDAAHHVKEIFVFTDGVNETSGFNMPALIPTGVANMMQLARTNRLIVPLAGVRVYVFGASTANLNPEAWNTIKNFWVAYFRDAGADVAAYSSEASVFRK